ncbi:MAG: chromate efflux transporter [Terracidiphilus sp.]
MASPAKSSPGEIFRLFLRLGLTAFGGPAAHLVLMEREAVERRGWMSRAQFLDLVGACNLLPGPGSTQVAMALGYRRAGWIGLLIAGVCFILPASLATMALAWAYVRYGSLPQAQGLLYGAKPVMVAIIVQAVWKLGGTAFRRWPLALAGLACFAAALLGAPPIAVLLAAGGLALLAVWRPSRPAVHLSLAPLPFGAGGAITMTAGLGSLFLVFLKLGVVVFGSGYVLVAFLKADLVDRLHWITMPQLLDAITAGQVTPGPVFATATFLGYLLRGWPGAVLATVAIFLPSFFMAGMVGAFSGRIRQSKLASAFLDGVNAAAVALMAAVALSLGGATLLDGWTWALALASVALLLRFRINATWLILGGATIGLLLHGSS